MSGAISGLEKMRNTAAAVIALRIGRIGEKRKTECDLVSGPKSTID